MSKSHEEIKAELPYRITAIRTFTYFPREIVDSAMELENMTFESVEEVYDLLHEFMQEDFRSVPSRHDVSYVAYDENDNEVDDQIY